VSFEKKKKFAMVLTLKAMPVSFYIAKLLAKMRGMLTLQKCF